MKLTIPITRELRVRLLHAQNLEIEVPDTAVPEGWQIVPVEPTNDMLAAGYFTNHSANQVFYKAMLAAAPKPEEGAS